MLRQINLSLVVSPWSLVKNNQTLVFSILSGLLLALPYSFGKLWIISWFAFVPLFFALRGKNKKQSFFFAYLCGFAFWLATIYWLVNVTLTGTIILALYLALYFAVFGLFFSTMTDELRPAACLIIPSAWVVLEYMRGHLLTGFPWALLGYSQCSNLPIIQIADIVGAYGVSFLVVMINYVVFSSLLFHWECFEKLPSGVIARQRRCRSNLVKYIIPLILLLSSLGYGYYKIYQRPTANDQRPIKISLIQGNIPQELKWDARSNEFILNRYLDLTRQAALDGADLIIWPEASLPVVVEQNPAYYSAVIRLASEVRRNLLIGAVTKNEDKFYNSALLVSASGALLAQYDKIHLVPFGEYIPLKKSLPFLETVVPIGDISRGEEYTIFQIPNSLPAGQAGKIKNKFAVLICFEDVFPEMSRKFIKEGAQFLVNITNDAWYKKTSAAYQHLQASIFRAVENRVYLLRSANTGISAEISPLGRRINQVKSKFNQEIFVTGFVTCVIDLGEKKSLSAYTSYGDIFIIVCILLVICGLFKKARRST